MEKLDKKKVLAVVLIIALIASLAATVSMLYSSIDMFLHSLMKTDYYEKCQLPYAIIMLIAFVAAAAGTSAGIISFVNKNEKTKFICVILALCAAVAILILTVASAGVYLSNEAKSLSNNIPVNVSGDPEYAVYSAVMTILLQQLIYGAITAAVLLIVYIFDKKSAKAQTEQKNEEI